MGFSGWPVEGVEFYEGLEADNSRTYWHANKAVYDECVKAPMEALLAELAGDFGVGRIFRPNRDTRFSKDKTPYKVNCAAAMPGGYVSFSADGLFAGAGLYRPEPPQLARFREAVADDKTGPELEKVVAALGKGRYEVGGHEVLKTAPKGYEKDHPRIELLRQKGIVMSKSWPVGAWLGTKKAKDRVGRLPSRTPGPSWPGSTSTPASPRGRERSHTRAGGRQVQQRVQGRRRTVRCMNDARVRSTVYLVLAVGGLVGTGYFNVQWLDGDFEHTVSGFLEAAFANSASSSFGVDLTVAFLAGAAFMLFEGRRIGMRYWWVFVVLSSVIAYAFALPLFFWARERHLAGTAPEPRAI